MKIYQAFLGSEQKTHVSPIALPYDVASNTGKDQREYELFKLLHKRHMQDPEPWGLVSWKFEHKCLVTLDAFAEFARTMFDQGFDCVFINPMIGNEAMFLNVWEQGHISHQNMREITAFLATAGVSTVAAPMGPGHFAFCNYFLGNEKLWKAYFAFIEPVIDRLEHEKRIGSDVGKIYSGPGGYVRDAGLTMRIFVIERLFSSFLSKDRTIRSRAFPFQAAHYHRKFGERLGAVVHGLSALKSQALETNDKDTLKDWHEARAGLMRDRDAQRLISMLDDPPPVLLASRYHQYIRSAARQD